MLKKFIKSILGNFWGRKVFQPAFEKLFFFSIRGMNIGGGSFLSDSGELGILEKFTQGPWQKREKIILFDVGANKGEYSLAAAEILSKAGKQMKILAFEPSPATFELLSENLKKNPSISAYNLGLGSAEQKAVLYSDQASSGMASLYNRDMSYFNIEFSRKEEVVITTLDKFCTEQAIDRIDFLKLDVEGNEMEVLKGASGMLGKKAVDCIQFEFGGANIDARVFLRDFVNLLKADFNIYRILKDGVRPLAYSEFSEIFVTTNFLAVSKHLKS